MYLYHELRCWLRILSNGVHSLQCRILSFGGSNGLSVGYWATGVMGSSVHSIETLISPCWLCWSSTIIFSKSTVDAPIFCKMNATLSRTSFVISFLRVATSSGGIVLDWVPTHYLPKAFFNPTQTPSFPTTRLLWSFPNTICNALTLPLRVNSLLLLFPSSPSVQIQSDIYIN